VFETILTILIFIAVIAVTVVLFGGWLVVVIVRAVAGLLLWPFRRASNPPAPPAMLTVEATDTARCGSERCRAENPAAASFCRRCGAPMRAAQQVPVRRVAMW
jgi:hypothetical protein